MQGCLHTQRIIAIMEDKILYIWGHSHDRLPEEMSLAACLVPPIQKLHI